MEILRNTGVVENRKKSSPGEINKLSNDIVPPFSGYCKNLLDFFNNNKVDGAIGGSFNFTLVYHGHILDVIGSMKTNAMGLDGINPDMIKLCYLIVKNHLLHIVNSCFLSGYFLNKWKLAQVIPVPEQKT